MDVRYELKSLKKTYKVQCFDAVCLLDIVLILLCLFEIKKEVFFNMLECRYPFTGLQVDLPGNNSQIGLAFRSL